MKIVTRKKSFIVQFSRFPTHIVGDRPLKKLGNTHNSYLASYSFSSFSVGVTVESPSGSLREENVTRLPVRILEIYTYCKFQIKPNSIHPVLNFYKHKFQYRRPKDADSSARPTP